MSRLCIETRGLGSWRERLADPDLQWKRGCSAFEAAVSWELARSGSGLPAPIDALFRQSALGAAELGFAVAEHKVALAGRGGDSQCDVWALVKLADGLLSLSVEAKALEAFGNGHEPLRAWLLGGKSANSGANRETRWRSLAAHLPVPETTFDEVPFQLLHRCAAAVVEARRLGLRHAAFVVQAFEAPESSFHAYCRFGAAVGLSLERNRFASTSVGDIALSVRWADCPFATDPQVAAVVA